MDLKVKTNYASTSSKVNHLFTTPKACNEHDKNRTVDIYRVYGVPVEKTYFTEDLSVNQKNRSEKVLTKQTLSTLPVFVNGSYVDSNGNPYGRRDLLSVGSVIVERGTQIKEDTIVQIKIPGSKTLVEELAGLIYFDC